MVATCIALLGLVGLARLREAKRSSARNPLQCQRNLQEINLALFDFTESHGDRFPWEVSAREGGSLESVASGQATPHFRALTNSIRNARVLLCPMDPIRHRGTTIATFDDSAISYFFNVSATGKGKNLLLAGDRTLSLTEDPNTGAMGISGQSVPRWVNPSPDEAGHQTLDGQETTGNVLLGNGSLIETTSKQLQRIIRSLGTNTQQLILP